MEAGSLLDGRRLVRNAGWNLAGSLLPVLLGLACIPVLIAKVGADRFGVLTLVWAVIGYFALFDLGLARSLTRVIARCLGDHRLAEIPVLVGTGGVLLFGLGVIMGVGTWFLSPLLVEHVLAIPAELRDESLKAFYGLALSIPLIIWSAFYRALLEAYQRFGAANVARAVSGALVFVAPVVILPFSIELPALVGALVVSRLVVLMIYQIAARRILPKWRTLDFGYAQARELLSHGGWMMVTNVVGPVMVYFDRLLIGAMTSMREVAYYATPFEMITRLLVIAASGSSVLFPAIATGQANNAEQCRLLYTRGTKYVFLAYYPLVVVAVVLAEEALTLWLGPLFAREGTFVLQALSIGVLINGLAHMPFATVQGFGRADLTGKLHLFELPFYVLVLWWAVSVAGISGAAMAWTARATVDAIFLFIFAERLLPGEATRLRPLVIGVVVSAAGIIGPLAVDRPYRYFALVVALGGGVAVLWHAMLSSEERQFVRARARALVGGKE